VKILLGDGPVPLHRSFDSTSIPNLGALCLISHARREIPGLDIGFFPGARSTEEWAQKLAALGPDMYGMSFASPVSIQAFDGARELKKLLPSVVLIGGGPHPSIDPRDCFAQAPFDFLCDGEGETTFVEFVKALRDGTPMADVKGLWICTPDGPVFTGHRPPIKDISALPMPAWDLVDFTRYQGPNLVKAKPSTALLASRGCPYRCSFCSNPVWHGQDRHVRARTPAQIAEEVRCLYGRGIREIYIRSDEFNFQIRWAKDVCRAIGDLGLKDLFFQLNLRAEPMDEELAALLARMGVWLVHLGVESANQRVLDGIKKHITVEQVENTCRLLRAAGIHVYAFLMMYQVWEDAEGHLQIETPTEVEHTLQFTRTMFRKKLFHYMSWQIATPMAGSELHRVAIRHGLITADKRANSVWDVNMDLPGIARRTVLNHRRRGMLLQSWHALLHGHLNYSLWRRIVNKIRYILEMN
jgi:anaerobic magnesium-protoporphyrin IX monomethyl ester cyclase